MGIAFVFPGQGSQSIGMLAALAASSPVVRETFDAASAVLGYDLWQLAQEGPVERLNETECTQPAMLTAGYATWSAWQARDGRVPDAVSGHSLGEFTALVAAGALDFAAAVVKVRALIGGSRARHRKVRRVHMPACYDEDLGPDLAEAAQGQHTELLAWH